MILCPEKKSLFTNDVVSANTVPLCRLMHYTSNIFVRLTKSPNLLSSVWLYSNKTATVNVILTKHTYNNVRYLKCFSVGVQMENISCLVVLNQKKQHFVEQKSASNYIKAASWNTPQYI